MASCCILGATGEPGSCMICGARGLPVPRETLEHLLKSEKRVEMVDEPYYFCQTPECDIVYFADVPFHYFDKDDLTVRVGVKETEDPIPVCYCFDFTERDIIEDVERHGEGRIFKEIAANVKAGLCACEIKNPSGRCCLGNVQRAMRKARVPVTARRHGKQGRGGEVTPAHAIAPES
ncbi:MAG: putative iron-sulfur cluster-binding metallochaperone [Armatimonadota bacterium]